MKLYIDKDFEKDCEDITECSEMNSDEYNSYVGNK